MINVGDRKDKLGVTVNASETLSDIVSCLGNFIEFVVSEPGPPAVAARPTVNPLMLMTAAQHQSKFLPPRLPEGRSNKTTKLKNDILKWCEENELGWTSDAVESEGKNFVGNLATVFRELDGHHHTFSKRGCPVPSMFGHFVGTNQPKKMKHQKRCHTNLGKHKIDELSQTLFELCGKSYLKMQAWKSVRESLLRLAHNLRKYATYLEEKLDSVEEAHARKTVCTDVDEWVVYNASGMSPTKAARYKPLHDALHLAKPYETVFVNEFAPTDSPMDTDQFLNQISTLIFG